ncbi:hypothetical protein Leryth_000210 [Lithospermum erythrorhizon]|nr:hypothetical protein Leryth_000210 [Lithospermum erythrorhizon]
MAATLQFPFTLAQWKELERQATIYKYMMASIPVPPHLLFPLTTNFSAGFTTTTTSGWSGLYGWRYSSAASNSKDAEPGRCKRTDGKKWRCSRDVAPNQKYCERHMHRGRPRSRKHVEVQPLVSENNNNGIINSNKKIKVNNTTIKNCPLGQLSSQEMVETTGQSIGTNHVLDNMNTDLSIKTFANRDVNWLMEDKVLEIGVEQQWPNFMNQKIDDHPSLFQQQYVEREGLNLFSYTNDESQFFLNSDNQPKGRFVDACSNDGLIRTTNCTNDGSSLSSPRDNISPSLTLSMAMAAGNIIDEEMKKIQEGGCDYENKDSNFFSTHSWIPFASCGGPLAEVLHTGSVVASPSNPASSLCQNQ